jgi:hypothetical protein
VLDHARKPKAGFYALRDACRSALPMLEPREGLVHVVSELRLPLCDAVVEAVVDGRRHAWSGDVPADGISYLGRLVVPEDARHVSLTLKHPEVGEVTSSYDDLLEWLRIVSG